MKDKLTFKNSIIFAAMALATLLFASVTFGQSSSFTYQGRLTDGGTGANGNYDFQFSLWDSLSGGLQVGSSQALNTIAVSDGVFSVSLNFGANSFTGANRFLEISARPSGSGSFTLLIPRQQLSSTPYSVRSASAAAADTLSTSCSGCIADTNISAVAGSKITGAIPVSAIPPGSSNYLQNTNVQQPGASFNVSGSGTVGGDLTTSGRVGIGTLSPQRTLQIGPSLNALFTAEPSDVSPNAGFIRFGDNTGWKLHIGRSREKSISAGGTLNTGTTGVLLTIQDNGLIGIATTSPIARIDIGGVNEIGIRAISNQTAGVYGQNFGDGGAGVLGEAMGPGVHGKGTPGVLGEAIFGPGLVAWATSPSTLNLVEGFVGATMTQANEKFHINAQGTYVTGSDFAEALPGAEPKNKYEPGDVLVVSNGSRLAVQKSGRPNDPHLVGVYSTRPGMLGAEKNGVTRLEPDDLPVAIVGIVPTKVSTENGPIQAGDLLTTSATPGYAMKALPIRIGRVRVYRTGTILGKALEPLTSGKGTIKVLVTLR